MTPRTQQILEAVIHEFIETGEPVSSLKLLKEYDFDVKSATIRNELNDLIQEGYLNQLHTSSGRVPTDKGYRFLVEKIIETFVDEARNSLGKHINLLINEFSIHDFHDFITDLSDTLELLGVGYLEADRTVYKSGLDELFGRLVPDYWIKEPQELFKVVQDFERLEDRIQDLLNFVGHERSPKVFIGKSPITTSRELSVIANRFYVDGSEVLLAAVGPKRMDYSRNINFFIRLKKAGKD